MKPQFETGETRREFPTSAAARANQKARPWALWGFVACILAIAVLVLTLPGCVAAQDTQAAADAQRTLEEQIAAAQADQAAGVPADQVQAAIKQALADYAAQMKTIGQDVGARTLSFWELLRADPAGTGLGLVLSQLPMLLGWNVHRNRTRAKALEEN